MPIITVAYQKGSGGREIAKAVAEQLNLAYLDKEIVQAVANRLGISETLATSMDEKVENRVLRILEGLRVEAVPVGASAMRSVSQSSIPVRESQFFDTSRHVIEGAAYGNKAVIVGHGANFVLAGRKGLFRVYIYAPIETRVSYLANMRKIEQTAASKEIEESDRNRDQYAKTAYGADWHSPDQYDLMINTSSIDHKLATRFIIDAVRSRQGS